MINILSGLLASSSFSNAVILYKEGIIGLYFLGACFIFGYSILMPMLFIKKWTVSYNNNLLNHQKTNKS